MARTTVNTTEPLRTVTSRDVINTTAAGSVDALSPGFPVFAGGDTPSSVLPNGTTLNGNAAIKRLDTVTPDASGFDGIDNEREIASIPVADYITNNGFKVGSKLVIRIVPTATAGNAASQAMVSAARKNAELYFPYAGLEAVNEMSEEKVQIFEGFDAHKLLFFGRKVKVWSFQVMVMNGVRPAASEGLSPEDFKLQNMDFANELYRRYEAYYSGTKCVEMQARCFMTYEDRIVEGYLVMMSKPLNAQVPGAVTVTLTMILSHDSFTVNSLTQQSDQTLAQLLAGERDSLEAISTQSPTQITGAAVTAEQLLDRYAANQSATAAAQSEAQELRNQGNRAQELQRQAAASLIDVAVLRQGAEDELAQASNLGEEAAALSNIAALDRLSAELESAQQELGQTAALSSGDVTLLGDAEELSAIEKVTRKLDAVEFQQKQRENNLKFSVDGDLTSAVALDKNFTEVLQTLPDGKRVITTYDTTEDPDAFLDGLSPIDTRDVTQIPEYNGVPDGTNVRKTRIHVQ